MKYRIPVEWLMVADIEIEADNLDAAIELAQQAPIPNDGQWLEDSFKVNTELAIDYEDSDYENSQTF